MKYFLISLAVVRFFSVFSIIGFFPACGDKKEENSKEEDNSCTFGDVGCGASVSAQSGKITINFDKAAAGDKYVIIPYSVGNIDKIDGATAEKAVTFEIPVEKSASAATSFSARHALMDSNMLAKEKEDAFRLIAGKFRPSLGVDGQAPGFWSIVKYYDQLTERQMQYQKQHGIEIPLYNEPSLELSFKERVRNYQPRVSKNFLTQVGSCPEDEVAIPGEEGSVSITSDQVVVGEDYCIVYVDEPLIETDKTAIENTIKTVLNIYKKKIYKDEFAPIGDFVFKPQFIIMNFNDDSYGIPEAMKAILGAFEQEMTDDLSVPMLYLKSKFVNADGDDVLATDDNKKEFHATLAHEVQHAISYYYRSVKYLDGKPSGTTPVAETVLVDEGIAHFMEDIFGYGSEGFEKFPGNFLATFSYGLMPFLAGGSFPSSETVGEAINYYRGGSQALLYYLASRMGGFEFSDGQISGGKGLDFIVQLVTSDQQGAKNLQTAFSYNSWSWNDAVSNFLISTVVDNSSVENVYSDYQLPAVFKELTDLQGTANKIFGMRFNDFESVTDRIAEQGVYNPFQHEDPEASADEANRTYELYYYHAVPGLYTVVDSSEPFVIETSTEDTGTAAAVVRIK
ncbi:MAG: hypothetical protein R3B45_14335 [Bdellovibrionota bacterium]